MSGAAQPARSAIASATCSVTTTMTRLTSGTGTSATRMVLTRWGCFSAVLHLLRKTQDTLQRGALCWLGSTMRNDHLHCGMAWRQGQLQPSAFILQGCHLT